MVDDLEALLVDSREIDRELLATVLKDLVRIDSQSGEVIFTPRASRLSKRSQILVHLLGRKAAYALGKLDDEATSPKSLESKIGMSGGGLRGTLSIMKKERLVSSENGRYLVPVHAVERVKAIVEDDAAKT